MVRIENGKKIIIEIETPSPEEFLYSVKKGIIECVQTIQEVQETNFNPEIAAGVYFLLELYKALILDNEQLKKLAEES